MSQRIKVSRVLQFIGDANQEANVEGDMLSKRMNSVDWFDQVALDTTLDYTLTLSGSTDLGALEGGGVAGFKGTTGNVDDDISFLATGLIFDITQKPAIEAKIKIVDVSQTIIFFGFSDATSETTPAATIDAAGGTPTAAAADAVGFVIDADYATSSIYAMSVKTGGTIQSVDSAIDWADNESKVLRVELDASGNAHLFIDGVEKAYIALAVADVPLCAILNYGTRAAGGLELVHMRYLARFQDLP